MDSPGLTYHPYQGGYVGRSARARLAGARVAQGSVQEAVEEGAESRGGAEGGGERGGEGGGGERERVGERVGGDDKKRRGRERLLEEELDTDAERAKRARRMGRFGTGEAVGGGKKAAQLAAERHERLKSMKLVAAGVDNDEEKEEFWDSLTIRGTNTNLEKSYFRLTSAPDPATVRPQPVLEKALRRLKTEAAGESYFTCRTR